MSLFEISTAAHLTGSIVLALFFVLLARHDPRPYLRDWTAAWIAQVLALAVLLVSLHRGWHLSLSVYLFLETVHGLFILSAARDYATGLRFGRVRLVLLAILAVWSGAAPVLFVEPRILHAAQFLVLSVTYLTSTALLWRFREPAGMGLRLTTNVLGLLGLLYVLHAAAFWALRSETDTMTYLEAAPFTDLFLQTLLALGMVLAVMEAAQWALAATNEQLKEAERRLKVLAETDPLTGCFNRRVFRELVDDLRDGLKAQDGVVVVIDMDGLKTINDRDGHGAGDEAIRSLTDAIRARTRETDVLVRWGGDEFVLVIPGATPAEGEGRKAQIIASIAQAGFSATAGLAAYSRDKDIMLAVKEADEAMYRLKTGRRGGELPS
jgi:diguanylate cyclase (GGDEF)-like protein